MLEVKFDNLGNIKKAHIKLNKLTIFAGENNSGKTYLNYLLYALLDKKFRFRNSLVFQDMLKNAKDNGVVKIDINSFINENYDKLKNNYEHNFEKGLDRFFSAKEGTFAKFKIQLIADKELIKDNLLKDNFSHELSIGKNQKNICEISKEKENNFISVVVIDSTLPNDLYLDFINEVFFKIFFSAKNDNTFILPAERTGLNLFYQELNSTRNALINSLQKNKTNPIEVLKSMMVSSYPQPIADYIEFLNNTTLLKKQKSLLSDLNLKMHHNILKGTYNIDKDGAISFLPYKKYFNGSEFQKKIELHMSSSTVKTFFSLEFYIEYMAKEEDFLIIDEPELNLHPDNQRNIAKLIAQIVNRGVNVIISTHSDYIVRELNNLIMLNEDFESKVALMEKYGYENSELLSVENVNAYLINNGTVESMEINSCEGIIAKTFDNVVNKLNSSSDEIYYTKMEAKENEKN